MSFKLAAIFFLTTACISILLGTIIEKQATFFMQKATVHALLCIAMAIMAKKEK